MTWNRVGLVLMVLLGAFCTPAPRQPGFKVVVLGFDGVDPDLVDQWIEELPTIRRLGEQGTLSTLGTTNPPESPVAWASFATGLNPGRHGIFDFLRRDPATYMPDIGLVKVEKPRFLFKTIPIRGARVTNNRKGVPYWEQLDRGGIVTANLRLPLEFPPRSLDHGTTLSGLGVPDVRGTWGTYFYLSTDVSRWDLQDTEFGGRVIRLEGEDGRFQALIDGPADPREEELVRLTIPLSVELDPQSTALTIRLQDQEEEVDEGQWSDWFRFVFSAGPLVKIRGISRFYVLETFPEVRLYLMPISLDPAGPVLPLSTPAGYSGDLASWLAPFKTLGWIHETWGLNEEQIDEQVFLEDLFRNMNHLERLLMHELDRGEASLYTAVFTATDSAAHMFYRFIDPQHPRYDAKGAQAYGRAVLNVYRKMDSIVSQVVERLDPQDLLLVVSDHGFHSWRKEFNTNTWLLENGFLVLKGVRADTDLKRLEQVYRGGSFFPNVDWSRTQAYALGLGHIYVNLKGREGQGIVDPGRDYMDLVRDISREILEYRDPETGEAVVQNAYFREDIYSGDEIEHAGDIQLSFRSGYRTSWQTALGAVPEHVLVANLRKWSGDHCASDFSDTEGFAVSNRKILSENLHIMDVAPTLYRLFQVEDPGPLDGRAWAFESP
ncbi:MAG: alkaline phosphatase family protein [Acidobacteriota bacterium]|nr:alkaline phosphatase family protein [Acidobacteriota bacterium]